MLRSERASCKDIWKTGSGCRRRLFPCLSFLVLIPIVISPSRAAGPVATQIVRDGTVGPDASVQPRESPPGVYEVGESLGARAGSNLFHSFQTFNIATGDTALFTARSPTENVISRITGGSSSIYGSIRSEIPGADVYLLNPSGILFGPDATLDVQGSFHASTADVLRMEDEDGNRFLAFSEESLLRTAAPTAFGFLSESPTPLTVNGSTLRVPEGAEIALVGGQTEILGGELTARSGRIQIASVASEGEAVLGEEGLDTTSFAELGNVVMTDGAKLDVSESVLVPQGAGSIFIRAGGFILDSSRMLADTAINSGGAIDVDVRGRFVLSNGARVRSLTDWQGDAAPIQIAARDIEISGGSRIESSTAGPGKASDVNIHASGSVVLSNPDPSLGSFGNGIASDVTLGAEGDGGDIVITTPSLTLERSVISADTIGLGTEFNTRGRPGNIRIETNDLAMSEGALITNGSRSFDLASLGSPTEREILVRPLDPLEKASIRLIGPGTKIQSEARLSTQGGASITLEASDVSLSDGAIVSTTVFGGAANAGNIDIAADDVSLQGSSTIQSDSFFGGDPFGIFTGGAGEITIQAKESISLDSEGLPRTRVSTTTFGAGDGGRIFLSVHDGDGNGTLSVDNAAIESNNLSILEGVRAGDILVDADVVRIENGGLVESVASLGTRGPAGQVTVGATVSLTVQGSGPGLAGLEPSAISTLTAGEGPAGDVSVSSDRVEVTDGGLIDSFSSGAGRGGTIRVGRDAEIPIDTRQLVVQRGGRITAASLGLGEAAGAAGTVEVDVERLMLKDGGRISARTTDGAPVDKASGTIDIFASESVKLRGVDPNDSTQASRIEASTEGRGDAGNVLIQTRVVTVENGARISVASSSSSAATSGAEAGAAGSIFVGTETTPVRDLTFSQSEASAFAVDGPPEGEPREGNINVFADGLLLIEDGSSITSSVENGLGGDITIRRPKQMVMRDGSEILAQTDIGTGGQIRISSDLFITSPDSVVSADAGVGVDGDVDIDAPEVKLQTDVVQLSTPFLDASSLMRPACAARAAGEKEGSFVVARRRGAPESPEEFLQAFHDRPEEGITVAMGPGDLRGERERDGQTPQEDLRVRSDVLRGAGQVEQAAGHHLEAVKTLEQSLVLAEQSGDPIRIASALSSLGSAYLALEKWERAEELLLRSADTAKRSGRDEAQARALNNLGNLYAARQKPEAALDAYRRGANLAGDVGLPVAEAKALANAVRAAIEAKRMEDAVALAESALAAARALPESVEKIAVLIHVAKSYETLSGTSALHQASLLNAHGALTLAVDLARKSEDERALSYAVGNLGALYQIENRFEEALYLFREALRAAEFVDAPELLYRWHWKVGQVLWAQGRPGPAIDAFSRAVEILEETRQEALSRYGSAEVYFRRAVAPVYLDLVDALLRASALMDDPSLAERLWVSARSTVERFKAAELRDYYRDECVADLEARTTTPESVSPTVAVVYPILLPDRLEILLTLPQGVERHTVAIGSDRLSVAVRLLRRELRNRFSTDYRERAQTLYEWLVEPYESRLAEAGIDTLVFVPDGPLRTIPMSALHDGQRYLVEKYSLVVAQGLALVDPQPLERQDPPVLLAGVSESVQEYDPLPWVREELQAVQELFGGELLLDEDFQVARIEEEMVEGRPAVVHIASHAVFTGDPDTSWLLTHDSRLTMEQLSDVVGVAKFRDEPLELLTLSACQTAAGDDRAALGLAGVAIRAGARSALGSLWKISDEAAYKLMSLFYAELKDPRISKAEALQQAQLGLLQSDDFQHPFYWSPFLITGNWL